MLRDVAALQGKTFDLLVCGGGIYGAWVAWDAALRGLSVALIDQADWAGATSSASSKLIHGGLRYLEHLQISMVAKTLAERQRLLSLAPHRVWPLRFSIPVYRESRLGRVSLATGLLLYHRLAPSDEQMKPRYWSRRAVRARWSMLRQQNLLCAFSYGDAQTDDARLVLELVAAALAVGAVCVNYCQLLQYQIQHGKANGALVLDQLSEAQFSVSARRVFNAAGRWQREALLPLGGCRLSKGVHLILPDLQLPEALLLTAKTDGRVFFVMPWYGRTLLGTTDQDFSGDLSSLRVEAADIAYLLNALNDYLAQPCGEAEVIAAFVGLRLMRASGAASVSAASRDWELKTDAAGVLYSVGGKITSARQDAAQAVDQVCRLLGHSYAEATATQPLPWAPLEDWSTWQTQQYQRGQQLGVDDESLLWLLRRFGRRVDEVFALITQHRDWANRMVPELPLVYADLYCCAQTEMVVHLDDLLRRRMPLLILAQLSTDCLRQLALWLAPALGWDAARIEQELARLNGLALNNS